MGGYYKECLACETKLKMVDRYCRMCGRRQPETITETDEVNVYPNPLDGVAKQLFISGRSRSRIDNPRIENGQCGAADRGYALRVSGENSGVNILFESLQSAEDTALWMLKQIADQREAHDLHHSPESDVETTADLRGDTE